MRSPNWFWTSDRFITFASWKDRAGPFALWPSLMVETQVDLGADVQSARWTLVLGRRRWQMDFARYTPRATAGKIDWSTGPGGAEEMLRWAKKVFRRNWTKADLEKLFAKKPEWRRLVIQSGARHHYVRVLLARELMDQESGLNQVEPLPRAPAAAAEQLAAALRMPKTDEKFESEWSNASLDARRRPFRALGTVEGQDPMEQLDHLANLLDLPQEVRDLDHQGMVPTETSNAPSIPAGHADALPVRTTPLPPETARPSTSLPSYLPMPVGGPNEADAARLLEASLSMDHGLPSDLGAALAQTDDPVPTSPKASDHDHPTFLPPPGPQDDTSRALAEALQRALNEPESSGKVPPS